MWRTDTVSVTGLAEPEEVVSLDVTDGVLPILGVQPALGRSFTQADDAPGSPETVILTARILAIEVRRRSRRDRTADPARRPRARDHRRAARHVQISRPQAGARPAAAARSQQDLSRQLQLQRDRAAEAGRHDRSGDRRRRAHDSDRARTLPAVPGLQREDVRGGAAGAGAAVAEAGSHRRRQHGALGADGHDRHGAADRVRERRQPAAGAGRRAPTGAGDSGRARRQPRRRSRASCSSKA